MSNSDSTILLFTDSYPYSLAKEDTFIEPELHYLQSRFLSIILIPKSFEGQKTEIPKEIFVDLSLAESLKLKGIIRAFFYNLLFVMTSLIFYRELLKNPKITLQPTAIVKNIFFLGTALRTKRWIQKQIRSKKYNLFRTIFYTYWLNEITMGICLAKKKYPKMIIISRAHGGDLYEERHNPNYIPYRPEIFKYISGVFPDSEKGKGYLKNRYSLNNSIIFTSRLGVTKQNFITESSDDNIFRIVTCSYLVAVKRIDLLIEGLSVLAKIRPNNNFEWTHIGDGPLKKILEEIASKLLPKNIKFTFTGSVPKGGVITYYKNHKIDVFINVSSSEGTPVSVMEAQSCGIPIIATSVGGNTEIVNNENGYLLPANPSPSEIAYVICNVLENPSILIDKKQKSIENWNKWYNSEKNFNGFAQNLIELLREHKIQ
mgnify:CR=1 FL=1